MQSSIYESFILPSKGMIYDTKVDPNITLRSMTTLEEMKRLSPTDTPYKVMSDIIEDCMKEKPAIHVYDMCLGDYQFLLHKLRIITYGPEYKMTIKCNQCGEITEAIGNLESLEVKEWDPLLLEKRMITLPVTNKQIELNFQTPKDLDLIAYQNKEMRKHTKQNIDYTILFTLTSLIKKIDGQILNSEILQDVVKHLPNRDSNYILNKASELSNSIGVGANITTSCRACGGEMTAPFRITSEFFGPTNY